MWENKMKRIYLTGIVLFLFHLTTTAQNTRSGKLLTDQLKLAFPDHGFVSSQPASKWEESMITGNGTMGALVFGSPFREKIILSHEKLFMPEYPPTKAPNLGENLDKIRELVLNGEGEKAAVLAVELGVEAGIEDLIWTDPLVPACQIEIESLLQDSIANYARSVNYETGEAVTAWETKEGVFHRKIFTSRPDNVSVLKIYSPDNIKQNIKIRLKQLPIDDSETNSDLEDEFSSNELIEEVKSTVNVDGTLTYYTLFQKKWEGSLKGYMVEVKVIVKNGEMSSNDGWLFVNDTDEILVLSKIKLSYDLPVDRDTDIDNYAASSYEELLEQHAIIHGEMFNRFSLSLGSNEEKFVTSEDLLNSSSFGKLNNNLLVQLLEAARYTLISSTGELPPTLQGIWGGTWRPAWSGDFTLNGNVPSAIACGLNSNFQEVTEAYINYMWTMFDDFKDNAHDLYGAPGIFVPSRSSSSGKTYHYLEEFPHLYWYAGNSWTSHFFYDYWQYTGDENFLKEKAIPFMMESVDFYEFILMKDEDGKFMFVPSYSPEVGPLGFHPVVINATMDIAGLKQLLRNLLKLSEQGYMQSSKINVWKNILEYLPDYEIDEGGDLKEWIWQGLENDNEHRHASHLYPLFYEMDPDFEENPELIKAAVTAIENRLKYRRDNNGAEMAFGLVQKGLAAAHIKDIDHAYECVDWLCNSYWSPAFTSYHDPGEIFNVDICGGLPAVVTEMIIQSSATEVELLPSLPGQWADGEIRGVLTRCGVTIDFEWKDNKPLRATISAQRNTAFNLIYNDKEWSIEIKKDQILNWEID
jgi:hypothetical protein